MSQATTYEQLIARKLEDLIVPDHANAIWATIEQQLDIEMPTNGNSGSGGFNRPDWWIGGGFFTLIVAIFMYLTISKQHLPNSRIEKEKPVIIDQHPNEEQVRDKSYQTEDVISQGSQSVKPQSSPQFKELTEQVSTKLLDTVASSPKVVAEPVTQSLPADTVPKQKKSKGMKGITDADYRIVPSQTNQNKNRD